MKLLGIVFILLFSLNSFGYESEVPDAQEAAPKHITQEATFLVWSVDRYITKIKGTNEFTCLVLKDMKGRFEPSCLNKAAMESVLPVYEYQTQLLLNGENISDIYKKIESF